MKYLNIGGWHCYATDNAEKTDPEKGGKWMHFFSDEVFARITCERAVEEGVCDSCKCTDTAVTGTATGVICFYLNADDIDGHKLSNDIFEVYQSPGGKERYWDQVPLHFCKDNYKVEILDAQESDIVEIDSFKELKAIDKTYDV